MTVTYVAENATTVPEGYSQEDVAQCKALTQQIVDSLVGVKGHVALSALLTAFNGMVATYPPDPRFRAGQHLITVGAGIANAAIDDGGGFAGAAEHPAAIAQQISNLVATKRHAQTIDALLMVFTSLATKFPCCTKVAAESAAKVVKMLETAAAMTAPSSSTSVH